MTKNFGRSFLVIAALTTYPLATFAEEVVHFTNGAEMTVRSHTVENDKAMVRLDLGENNFISFPMSMVDKILNAGQDVFLNPTFHASNQGVAGLPSPVVADNTVRGGGAPVGYARQPAPKGSAGVMLGETADVIPASSKGGPDFDNQVVNSRRRFNPLQQGAQGSTPQVILPPQMAKVASQLVVLPAAPTPPPAETPTQEETPAPEDRSDNP